MTAIPKRPPIRSKKFTKAARGQHCTLRFFGICVDAQGQETTVFAHFHDRSFGMGMKADDYSGCDSCHACHMFLDHGWVGKVSQAILLRHMLTAMQETMRNRIERGIVVFPIDVKTPSSKRATKPRKPKEQRAKINGRSSWPAGRKLSSQSFDKEARR